MTDAAAPPEPAAKSRRTTYALWLLLALAGAGGGFYAMQAGLIPLGPGGAHPDAGASRHAAPTRLEDTAFVAIDPIMISLAGTRNREQLRFRAQLEVAPDEVGEVTRIMPRIVDVLNGYLRALEHEDLRDPLALTRLRSQMLRRIGIVAGEGRVRDLLIMEFVLN